MYTRQEKVISIHVPLRGTTPSWSSINPTYTISIHVPLRGTTIAIHLLRTTVNHFNPRPLAGDDYFLTAILLYQRISIHVPLRGTTGKLISTVQGYKFQSTSPCGGRRSVSASVIVLVGFQSTSPCGGRPKSIRWLLHVNVFQSTSPCGGRLRNA